MIKRLAMYQEECYQNINLNKIQEKIKAIEVEIAKNPQNVDTLVDKITCPHTKLVRVWYVNRMTLHHGRKYDFHYFLNKNKNVFLNKNKMKNKI